LSFAGYAKILHQHLWHQKYLLFGQKTLKPTLVI